jgi:hypothetical protein
MNNEGKVVSRTYQRYRELGAVDRKRLSDEERTWAELAPEDGNQLAPESKLITIDAPAGRYATGQQIDARIGKPGDTTRRIR